MSIFSGYIALFYSVTGLKKYWQKNYKEAIIRYRKACKLNSDEEENAYNYSYIGRSYLALERYDEAVKNLLISYNYFKKNNFFAKNDSARDIMEETLKALSNGLYRTRKNDRALEVEKEIELIKKRVK